MKKLSLFFFVVALAACSFGQSVRPMAALSSGDVKKIDKVTKINIIYDYSETSVGAFRKEEEYLNKKYEEYEKKEKGSGEKFKESWHGAKKKTFEPTFLSLFNKHAPKKINMTGSNYSTKNDYTLVVKTVAIEIGMNIGIMKQPAYIDMECIFKDESGNVLCVFFIKNAIGSSSMGFDYDVSSRLKESYAKSAKMLIDIIAKERKKAAKR